MKPPRDFVNLKGLGLNPVCNIIQKLPQPYRNLPPIAPNILIGAAKTSRPTPSILEHFFVQASAESFIEHIQPALPPEPLQRKLNVYGLPFVEFGDGGNVPGLEPCFLV